MERTYWEKIAPAYNEQIFDVLKQDKRKLIRKAITKRASTTQSVIDIGCAVGKWLPVLSPLFKSVTAIDISAKNLAIAAETHKDLGNVKYQRIDMSAPSAKTGVFDMAVCINAILTDSMLKRNRFFSRLGTTVRPGGSLVLVVPSLESWLLTRTIQQHHKIDRKLFDAKLKGPEAISRYNNIQQGNVEIDNVATKHYLADELELLLAREGFVVEERKKVEYEWTTEFINPPSWLDKPRPWDWLCVARKVVSPSVEKFNSLLSRG